MGFWHTGYMEFHEPVGFGQVRIDTEIPRHQCAECGEVWGSLDELRTHRFESHPFDRPRLFIQGRDLGAGRVRITRSLEIADVCVESCDKATINGEEVPLRSLPEFLAGTSWDVCHVGLNKGPVSFEFTLDFCIASESDLRGVEQQFEKTVRAGRLDTSAIEEFIAGANDFRSAIGYCDGICAYLYGVLAKEGSADSSLSRETYSRRYNKAADALSGYDRPIARMIRGLIEFHFNHFGLAAALVPRSRVGSAAATYANWIERKRRGDSTSLSAGLTNLEAAVTEWDTGQIVRLSTSSLEELNKRRAEIEEFSRHQVVEYDRSKLQVLLAQLYLQYGEVHRAVAHAKPLRNIPGFGPWAELLIERCAEG